MYGTWTDGCVYQSVRNLTDSAEEDRDIIVAKNMMACCQYGGGILAPHIVYSIDLTLQIAICPYSGPLQSKPLSRGRDVEICASIARM